MPSWPSADRFAFSCSGGFTRPRLCGIRFFQRALCLFLIAASPLLAQEKPAPKPTTAHRANELTLAGLRPGRATVKTASRQLGRPPANDFSGQSGQFLWHDVCRRQMLVADIDGDERIQVIRLGKGRATDCATESAKLWATGRGLKLDDDVNTVSRLYGPPDSKSPSTRDGQPLELWYYEFDWAGPDVPQVMEVLCTREQDGKPGRVVEITLAAPSL